MGPNALYRNTVSGEDFVHILQNPRFHTGRGYRRRVDRPPDLVPARGGGHGGGGGGVGVGGVHNMEVEMNLHDVGLDMNLDENDFDVEEIHPNSTGEPQRPNANLDTDVDGDFHVDEDEAAAAAASNINTTYYAKNATYNFKTQGHSNRRMEMTKLTQTAQYTQWEEAAKKEWAVAHAKFYIAIPKYQRRHDPIHPRRRGNGRNPNGNGRSTRGRRRRGRNLEQLPEQAPVIDVKAAEHATLGTKFQATGAGIGAGNEGNGSSNKRPTRRSAIRMHRVKGLTDDDNCRGGPIFECKLYYRSQDILCGEDEEKDVDLDVDVDVDVDDEEEDVDEGDGNADMKDDSNHENETNTRRDAATEEYKYEKINQVKQYHVENFSAANPQDAEEMLLKCQNKIRLCSYMDDVDEVVNMYYSNVVKGQFYGYGHDA